MNAIISKLKVAYDDWKTNIFGAIVAEKQQSQLQQQRQLQTAGPAPTLYLSWMLL